MGGVDNPNDVHAALVSLLDVPAVQAFIGDPARVFHLSADDDDAWPFVVFNLMGSTDYRSMGGIAYTEALYQVMVETRADAELAADAYAAVHAALQDQELSVSGHSTTWKINRTAYRCPPPNVGEDGVEYHRCGGLYELGVA